MKLKTVLDSLRILFLSASPVYVTISPEIVNYWLKHLDLLRMDIQKQETSAVHPLLQMELMSTS